MSVLIYFVGSWGCGGGDCRKGGWPLRTECLTFALSSVGKSSHECLKEHTHSVLLPFTEKVSLN